MTIEQHLRQLIKQNQIKYDHITGLYSYKNMPFKLILIDPPGVYKLIMWDGNITEIGFVGPFIVSLVSQLEHLFYKCLMLSWLINNN